MSANNEKIFFFKGARNRLLLGFLHIPVSNIKKIGFVYCHPFADELNLSQRVAVETSRKIAKTGFPVLRFDFSGCGDSQGELSEVVLSDWLNDLTSAIDCIKKTLNVEKVILWGLRLGASIALLHSFENDSTDTLLLWQPIVNFETYFNQFIKREVLSQLPENPKLKTSINAVLDELNRNGEVNIIGYPISNTFLESFKVINRTCFKAKKAGFNCMMLSISLMDSPSFALVNFKEQLLSNEMQVELRHIKTDSFWDRYWRWSCPELTEATTKWIENCGY